MSNIAQLTLPTAAPKKRKVRRVLDITESIPIVEFFKQVLKKVEGTPYSTYYHPWNDKILADRFDCEVSNIAGLRRKFGYEFKPAPVHTNVASRTLEERFNRLQRRLVALEEWAARTWEYKPPLTPDAS